MALRLLLPVRRAGRRVPGVVARLAAGWGAAFVGQALANCASLAPTWAQDAATRAGPAPSETLARWLGRGADEYR